MKKIHILCAEDDDGQTQLFKSALSKSIEKDKFEIIHFINGLELLKYIKQTNRPKNKIIILLDLWMPIMGGIDVLKDLKTNEELKNIPTIILTSDNNEQNIKECYNLGCNCYIIKRININYLEIITQFLGLIELNEY